MGEPLLRIARDGAVERVTLSRPDVRNAFNPEIIEQLTAWAQAAAEDGTLRAAVLGGAGAHFSAGADIAWMRSMRDANVAENRQDARRLSALFGTLDALPFPLIGRVQGAALGGGTGLVAVCDIVVAADDAVFGFTEVKLGLLPATIAPFVIAKIGVSAARELFLTGARFDAGRAQILGLVHAVVPAAELDARVDGYLREILATAPGAVTRAKDLIRAVAGRPATSVVELVSDAIALQRVSPEGQEGLAAFLEKRPPSWSK